jgi:hypothetical protein
MTKPSSLRIIVTGQMAQYPLGGVTWFYLQYVLGLARLGHDVYYIEDSGQWPYSPQEQALPEDCSFNVNYLAAVMARYGLADKWAYCFPWQSQWFGLSEERRREVIASADLLVNVSGTLERPQEYRQVRRMAYLDTDPVFTQAKLARGQKDFRKDIDLHDAQFSYGECSSSLVPDTGHHWRPTRVPIVLSEWRTGQPYRNVFTTIMNWTSHNSVVHDGRTYGQKDVEFKRFLDLPHRVAPSVIELAIGPGHGQRTPYDLLRYKGWKLVDPADVCPDLDSLRTYTESSMAEWSVAKNGYVVGQSGWFSERSARYLAAGRPVIVQDTGFSKIFPVGQGVVPFNDFEEAVDGIRRVESDYECHSRAARALAEEYFDSAKVLRCLVNQVMDAN